MIRIKADDGDESLYGGFPTWRIIQLSNSAIVILVIASLLRIGLSSQMQPMEDLPT